MLLISTTVGQKNNLVSNIEYGIVKASEKFAHYKNVQLGTPRMPEINHTQAEQNILKFHNLFKH